MENFELYKDKAGKFRFRLVASNGQVILKSQGYTRKESAQNGIKAVMKSVVSNKNFAKLATNNGQHYFVLKATNGEIIGTSEHYASQAGLELGIKSVIRNAVEPDRTSRL